MGTNIAVVGNGHIGYPTAYTIFNERLADEISLVDVKPGQTSPPLKPFKIQGRRGIQGSV